MMRRALAGLVLLAGATLLAAPAASAGEDEVVPQGIWLFGLTRSTQLQTRGITRLGEQHPLLEYLVPDREVSTALEGAVERRVERWELAATYGLSDTRSIEVRLPHVTVAQTASLASLSGSAAELDAIEGLPSRTISGPGNVRVAILQRPVFKDRHAFTWGYGVEYPLSDPESPWSGRTTLELDSPFWRPFALFHYTFYPFIERARLDLRGEAGLGRARELELVDGRRTLVHPGNDLSFSLGWQREYGPVLAGIALRLFGTGRSEIDGLLQEDPVLDHSIRLQVGYGNLVDLEQNPIAFPWQALLTYDQTVDGFNTPMRRELSVTFRFYF